MLQIISSELYPIAQMQTGMTTKGPPARSKNLQKTLPEIRPYSLSSGAMIFPVS